MYQNIVSFDIGKRNFAFVIEQLNSQEHYKELQNSMKSIKPKYIKSGEFAGTPTQECSDILSKLYQSSKIIMLANNDLTHGTKTNNILEEQIYINM